MPLLTTVMILQDQHLVLSVILLSVLSAILAVNGQDIIVTKHPANGTFCEGSKAVLSCVIFDNTTNDDADTTGWFYASSLAAVPNTIMISNSRVNDVVTSTLTMSSVSLLDDGIGCFCLPILGVRSYIGVISVAGPPGDISNMNIQSDSITACSFVVQWRESSSDSACDLVVYTVTISTEGGLLIITDNTTLTHYAVTGLNSNTQYIISVTASNNAGSSNSSIIMMTTSDGLPSSPPIVHMVTPLSNGSFFVNWTISNPYYNYTVIWTNLNTSVTGNYTVPRNTNSYIITGLIFNAYYNVNVAAIGVCGMMTSDPITTESFTPSSLNPSPTGTTVDTDASMDNSKSDTTIIIIIVVVIIVAVTLLIIVAVMILIWKFYLKEKAGATVSSKESNEENNYAQPNGNVSQENDNTDYAYANNGPRLVVHPSTNSEKPQQQ